MFFRSVQNNLLSSQSTPGRNAGCSSGGRNRPASTGRGRCKGLRSFLLLLILFSFSRTASGQEWQKIWATNRDEGFAGRLLHPSIVIDSNRALHLLFAESAGIDTGGDPGTFPVTFRYATNVYGKFGTTQPISSGQATLYSALGLDSAATLHAILPSDDGSGGSCLGHAARTKGEWVESDATACGMRRSSPSVATDRSGTLHVVYENGRSIYYRQCGPDGTWTPATDVSRNPDEDRTPSIAVAPDGRVHVAFYRWKASSRRALMYATAPPGSANFGPPQELRVMSGTTTGLDLPFAWPPFVPSISVDGEGVCHLVFTSIFGTNSELGEVLYMTDRGGSWSVPTAVTGIGFYNRSSVVAAPDGSLHVAAERRDPVGGDWDIVYVRNAGGGWEPERDLTGNDVNDFAPANGGRFIAARGNGLAIVYQTEEPNPERTGSDAGNEIAILTQLLAPLPVLATDHERIDFDTVILGRWKDTTLIVTNDGAGEIASTEDPAPVENSPHFTLSNAGPFRLAAGESDTIRIRFAPLEKGCFDEELRIRTTVGEKIVRLRGCGTGAGERTVWLDTVGGHVGDRLFLTARIAPAPLAGDGMEGFSIRIACDPRAIYPHALSTAAATAGTTLRREPDGAIVVERLPGSLLLDSLLFTLEIEGLATGKPENIVRIETAELAGTADAVTTRDGLVRLTGCDVGSDVAFGRGARIGGIVPFPAGGENSAVIWRAPAGFAPVLRIVDPQGKTVHSQTLPEGTGEEQRAQFRTDMLQPGWYVVELIDRAERHALPLLITE